MIAANDSGRGAARSEPAGEAGCVGTPVVLIDGGAAQTASPVVALTLRAPLGARTVQIANDPGFASPATYPMPADCTVAWTLPHVPGIPLEWTVYVRYDAGPAATYSDSIVVNAPS